MRSPDQVASIAADLVVDQASGKSHLAHHVLGDVGGHPRGAVGPSDPEPAVCVDRRRQGLESSLELGPADEECNDDVQRCDDSAFDQDVGRQRAQGPGELSWGGGEGNRSARLDPELLRQRS